MMCCARVRYVSPAMHRPKGLTQRWRHDLKRCWLADPKFARKCTLRTLAVSSARRRQDWWQLCVKSLGWWAVAVDRRPTATTSVYRHQSAYKCQASKPARKGTESSARRQRTLCMHVHAWVSHGPCCSATAMAGIGIGKLPLDGGKSATERSRDVGEKGGAMSWQPFCAA